MEVTANKAIMQKAAEAFTADELFIFEIPSKVSQMASVCKLPYKLQMFLKSYFPPKAISVKPPYMGTMIRVAGKGVVLPDQLGNGDGFGLNIDLLEHLDVVSKAAGALIKNSESIPSHLEQNYYESELTFTDLQRLTMATITFNDLTAIYDAYELKKEKSEIEVAMQAFKPVELPKIAESLPHYNIGSALRYFKGSMNENAIKWSITWSNYMLYIASIPESPDLAENNKKIEVKDADEIF
jgi:hypothetical protein